MGIPEAQLERWANLGVQESAQRTHHSVRAALGQPGCFPSHVVRTEYLQGSYRNHTNTRGSSDVDLVVQLNSVYRYDTSALSFSDQIRYEAYVRQSVYVWPDFYTHVYQGLVRAYGSQAVKPGRKAIKVVTPHLPADVVVCMEYRYYLRYTSPSESSDYVAGMTFYVPDEDRWVINFPKQHYENGNCKQQETGELFRSTVRMIKNARNCLLDARMLAEGDVPSYFIECLLYNIPSALYSDSRQLTYLEIAAWIYEQSDAALEALYCQNGLTKLFGPLPEQWGIASARALARGMLEVWRRWGA